MIHKIYFLFLISSNLALCQTSMHQSFELWTMTNGDFINQNAYNIIAKDYPFDIKPKSGDVVDDSLFKKINNHNAKMWDDLESNGYGNLKEKFYIEVENERNKINQAIDLVNKNPQIKLFLRKIKKSSRENYNKLKKINDSTYKFNIYSYDLSNLCTSEKLELKLKVNINQDKAVLLRNNVD